jgi:hypothetical protein
MSILLQSIVDTYRDEEILKADGFDDAVIGIEESSMRLIYSVEKCITILMKEMTFEEAFEYFYDIIFIVSVGDKTPIWCEDML